MLAQQGIGQLPEYFQSTYRMVASAFPEGISDDAYWPVLALLSEGMSYRSLARFLSSVTGKDYHLVYHDVVTVDSGTVRPPEAEIEPVRQRLKSCGYDAWLREE